MADETTTPAAWSPLATQLLPLLQKELGEDLVEHANCFGEIVIRVKPTAWKKTAEVAKRHLDCNYLSYISGIDWMPRPQDPSTEEGDTSTPAQPDEMTFGAAGSAGRFQALAHVASTFKYWSFTVKTDVDTNSPQLESWTGVYPGADWHERETWEMFGFNFVGHPNIRHLYLPFEFEGNPLRKDFPLMARNVKPWPGLVDVEAMPGADEGAEQ